LEGRPIVNNHESFSTKVVRHKGLIFAVLGVIGLCTCSWLYWSQKKAAEYEEAYRKGLKSWEQRDAEHALPHLRKAAKVDPTDPELWVLIGRAELASNRVDRALEAWEQALQREPGFKPALFERGKEAFCRHVAGRIPAPVDRATGWLSLQPGPGAADEIQRIWGDLKAGAYTTPEFTSFAKGANDFLEGRYKDAAQGFRGYADKNGWDAAAVALAGIANHYGALPNRAEAAMTAALALKFEKAWVRIRAEAKYLQANYEGAKEDYKLADLEKEAEPLFARRIPTPGMVLWLRADQGVEVRGDSVSKWADQSGGKRDAASKDAEVGPKVSAAAVKGLPAIQFSGGLDELRLPDGFEDFSAGLSMFVVGEPAAQAGEAWSFVSLATGQAGALPIEACIGGRRESDAIVFAVEDFKSASPPYVAGPAAVKEFEELGAIEEPSGAVRVYKRGQPVASGKLTLPSKTVRTRNRVGAGFKGRTAEILVYNRSLTDLERLGVDAYFKDRYFPGSPAAAPSAEKR